MSDEYYLHLLFVNTELLDPFVRSLARIVSYPLALLMVRRMSESHDTPRDGDRWFVNARRVLFVTPPSATGDRYVWHTQSARTLVQPTDRVDCIRASGSPRFEPDGTPKRALKPPKKDGVGFKGGSVRRHVPVLTGDDFRVDLQTPATQLQRKHAFAAEHTRMFTSTHRQLFPTPLVTGSMFLPLRTLIVRVIE